MDKIVIRVKFLSRPTYKLFSRKRGIHSQKESYDMASWQYINYTTSNGKYDLGQEKESEVEVEKGDIDTHLKLLNETSKHVKRNQIKNEEKYTFRLNTKGTDTQLVRTDGKAVENSYICPTSYFH